jgi:hypothetical protein
MIAACPTTSNIPTSVKMGSATARIASVDEFRSVA